MTANTRHLTLLALLLTACASLPGLPGTGPDIGVIADDTFRTFLRALELVDEQGCTLTDVGFHLTARCRVFRGPSGERIAVAYDLVSDRAIVALLLHSDGRQEILWRPVRQARTGEPEVEL